MTTRKFNKNKPCVIIPLIKAENPEPLLEPATIGNLAEPLLEVFKEEPQLDVSRKESPLDIPTDTHQPYNEIILKPKPEPTAPTPEASLFCSLCLRPCTYGQVVDFSADVASGWDKLALISGLELELERCEICRPCWTVVETLADFREGCLKAATWRARFSFGLDGARDDWLSKENVDAMEKIRKVVQKHVERIGMAEIEARNRLGFGTDDDQNYPVFPENPPKNETTKETQDIGDKLEITTFSCAKCRRIFETKTGMKIHFDLCKKSSKDKSTEPQLHKCSICSANFTKSYLLREHRNKHLGIKPYECRKENCNKRFHGNQAFQPEAGSALSIPQSHAGRRPLLPHDIDLSTHRPGPTFTSLPTEDVIRDFSSQKIPTAPTGIEPRPSGVRSNHAYHYTTGAAHHQKRCQGNNSSDQSTDQEISESSAVPNNTEENPPEIYPCKKCPRKFDTKGGLVNHSKKCKGPAESRKLHRCSICSIEFLHYHHLDAHMNRHNDTKPYQCKKNCDKRFYGKFELYRHTEICGKEKPICPLCGLQVSTKGGLTSHLETHAEVPTAECETCGKKFKSKKTLKKHQQSVHTNERNYPCDVCGKTLKSADSLNVHRRIHTHEKPFSCAVCGQRFAFKCLVKPHMKKNHAEEKI